MMNKQSSSYLSAAVLYKRRAKPGSMHSVEVLGLLGETPVRREA